MEFTEGSVTVPVAGKIKKRYVAIPAGVALAYVTYRWWQARQDQSAAEDTTSDGTYTSADLSDYGLSTTGGATTVTGNTGSVVTDGTGGMSTNAEWTQKAIELLTNAGYDGATVAAALGEFLGRRALDKTEASIARAALAVAGQPPAGGPYSVIEEATTGGTGTLAAPANLRAWDKSTDTQIGMQWDLVPGAAYYRVYRADLGDEPIGASYDGKFHARGLTPHHSYTFTVAAVSTTGKVGKRSNSFKGTTADRKLTRPTGLKASAITRSSFRVSCAPVKGAEYYRWYIGGRPAGASDQPYKDFTGMKAATTYSVSVAADLHTQNPGPTSSPIKIKTKR